ncbi:uncharacterized protein SCHCODRAFT_02683655 [Schizophyllum commune H4-8]|uniref:Uncharacterized protein n=1 Tax=Schizophyllum commune (strain H4-8 / FGSC 9210) TaxID=578458 RepID=D8PTI8_SCHCM|nr:uncharacterized protein SCHCODRAFT_02683655 [Schizophyllum commune H4-8]KAI5900860.1 hypothetical protein SCHCODRAFT_02683655 [Schizophyllum commune H4-8]
MAIAKHGRDCEQLSQRLGDALNNGRRARGALPSTAAHAAQNVESRPAVHRQFPNPATNRLLPSSFEPRPFWRQTRVLDSDQIVEEFGGRLLDGRQQRTALGDESRSVPNMARAPVLEVRGYRKVYSDDSNRERTLNQCVGRKAEGEATNEG